MANSNKAWQYQTLATQTLTSLFWGLKNGTASLENNLAISLIGTHKKKSHMTLWFNTQVSPTRNTMCTPRSVCGYLRRPIGNSPKLTTAHAVSEWVKTLWCLYMNEMLLGNQWKPTTERCRNRLFVEHYAKGKESETKGLVVHDPHRMTIWETRLQRLSLDLGRMLTHNTCNPTVPEKTAGCPGRPGWSRWYGTHPAWCTSSSLSPQDGFLNCCILLKSYLLCLRFYTYITINL